jgi:signal transduction histidine kinase
MTMLRQSHSEVRRLISGVRPPVLDESGIVAAIAHLVHEQQRQVGPKIEFRSAVEFPRLAVVLENAVYRIAQEALNNACQHSRSDGVLVQLLEDGGELELVVQDGGVGFQPESVPRGRFGLEGIRERTRLLDGRFDLETAPGSGTRLSVRLPLVLRETEE